VKKVVDNEDEDGALQIPAGLDNCWNAGVVVPYLIVARLLLLEIHGLWQPSLGHMQGCKSKQASVL
jgi:hypothetical protein